MIKCSFCGKAQSEVLKLVATADQSAVICDECTLLVVEQMIEGAKSDREVVERVEGGE